MLQQLLTSLYDFCTLTRQTQPIMKFRFYLCKLEKVEFEVYILQVLVTAVVLIFTSFLSSSFVLFTLTMQSTSLGYCLLQGLNELINWTSDEKSTVMNLMNLPVCSVQAFPISHRSPTKRMPIRKFNLSDSGERDWDVTEAWRGKNALARPRVESGCWRARFSPNTIVRSRTPSRGPRP